jgi:hypothetical protein
MTSTVVSALTAAGVALLPASELVGLESGMWNETGGYALLKSGGQVSRVRTRIVGEWVVAPGFD